MPAISRSHHTSNRIRSAFSMWSSATLHSITLQPNAASTDAPLRISDSSIGEASYHLRIAAACVILAAGLLGVLPPLVGAWLSASHNSTSARLIRACSGGVILALALVHILPEGYEQLEGAAGALPVGGMAVMAGFVAMMVLEYVATWCSMTSPPQHGHYEQLLPTCQQADVPRPPAPESPVHAHEASEACNKLCKTSSTAAAAAAARGLDAASADGHMVVRMDGGWPCHHQHHQQQHHVQDTTTPSLQHSHCCGPQPLCPSAAVQQQVRCVTLELGCVFHSVVLGLALGVMTESSQLVLTMMVVLAVHQALEGLAVGCMLAATPGVSAAKKLVCAVLYALTLPAAVVAGLAAASSYDLEAPVARVVQGVANAVSGGMLLYVSLFSLLAAELTQPDLLQRPLLAASLLCAVLLGAGVMSMLGLWA